MGYFFRLRLQAILHKADASGLKLKIKDQRKVHCLNYYILRFLIKLNHLIILISKTQIKLSF